MAESTVLQQDRASACHAPDDRGHLAQSMVEASPVMMLLADSNCACQLANPAFEQLFDPAKKEFYGKHLRDLVENETWQVMQPSIERVLLGDTVSGEQQYVLPGYNHQWYRTYYAPVRDEAGQVVGFVEQAIPLEQEQRFEENMRREKTFSDMAINSMPGIFYLFDQQGKFLRWNQNLEVVSGYSSSEIATMSPLDFFGIQDKEPIANAIRTVFTEGQVRIEAKFLTRDGRKIPYNFLAMRMIVDGKPILIGSGIDMSGRKEAEDTQRATLNILQDFDNERQYLQLVHKATLNLLEDVHEDRLQLNMTQRALLNMLEDIELERVKAEQANALLESVNRELEAFSYSVSHDLRAPLRAISGFAQAVIEDYSPRLDENGKEMLDLVQQNAARMGRLIDDLLAFSRLNHQSMSHHSINLQELVKTVFHELYAQATERKIKLTNHPVPPAWGDPAMIRQVMVNLISNAIKFTRQREVAHIEFGYLRNLEGGAYFMRDDGAGFDMQYANKLFGVFQRLHSTIEFEGTGVGLALVQRIITRHGGRVWAEGHPDQGATFYFTLPRREDQ